MLDDVADLLRRPLNAGSGPAAWPFAIDWVGHGSDRFAIAERVSPLTWIDAHDPPVFTAHGTADAVVPYRQAVALHAALDKAGVRNELLRLPDRDHGDLSLPEVATMVRRMLAFIHPRP